MVLLIDANVIVDYLLRREPFYDASFRIMQFCSEGHADGCVSLNSVTTIWYLLRKIPELQRRAALDDICEILRVVSASHESVLEALRTLSFRDFEDCIQSKCAEAASAEYIITRNVKDYQASIIPAITPDEFLSRFSGTT